MAITREIARDAIVIKLIEKNVYPVGQTRELVVV